MVRKRETLDYLILVGKEAAERTVFGDAGEKNQALGIGVAAVSLLEDRLHRRVGQGREEEGLVASERQRRGPFPFLPFVHVQRALGDNHDVGRLEPGGKVPQMAPGQEVVLMDRAVVVDEDDVDRGAEPAVLEGVVQDNQFGLGKGRFRPFRRPAAFRELPAAFHPVFVHGYMDGRKFLGNLERFVPVGTRRPVPRHCLEAARTTLVSPREHGQIGVCPFVALEQGPENHLRVGRFSGAAGRDVADADGRNGGGIGFFPAFVEQQVPQGEDKTVQHGYMESTFSTAISSWLIGLFILTAREMGT